MTVKLEIPRPTPVVSPEVRTPVAPGFAPGEPAPSATPAVATDGFERASAGTSSVGVGGSQFETAGAVTALGQLSESDKRMVDDMVSLFRQEHPGELGEEELKLAGATFYDTFRLTGHTVGQSVQAADYGVRMLRSGGTGTGGTSTQGDGCYLRSAQVGYIHEQADGAETLDDFHNLFDRLSTEMKPEEGQDPEMFKTAIGFELGKIMVEKGIGAGQLVGARVLSRQDGFQGRGNGGFVPGDRLEGLPRKLEPHREALEKLTGRLLRDSKLDNDAHLRKALWGELKQLPFPNDGLRRVARQHLLEEISVRQDRYTE